ncbi:MAG: hypothetical protein Mars2KO_34170 [Maribacter sp.]
MEENKELDDFIRKSVKELGFEQPPSNFTDAVLSKINASAQQLPTTVYQPVLSKKAWAGILIMVAFVFSYLIFLDPELEVGWLSRLNTLTAFDWSGNLPDIRISNTFVYGTLIGAFFVVVQVFMIKHFFDRRYELS